MSNLNFTIKELTVRQPPNERFLVPLRKIDKSRVIVNSLEKSQIEYSINCMKN